MIIGLFACIIIAFTGCSNEDDAKPSLGNIKLAVETTRSATASVGNGRVTAANDLVFTGGSIVIREVVFDGDNSTESTTISRTVEQIATIDYATGEVSPQVVVEVPPVDYRNVYLGIEMQDDGDYPSTVINGVYTNSEGVEIPLRFEFNSGEVFEAEADVASIEAGDDLIGKITFDALDWFSVVTAAVLDDASLTEGVMVISETSNTDIFDAVAARLDIGTEVVFE